MGRARRRSQRSLRGHVSGRSRGVEGDAQRIRSSRTAIVCGRRHGLLGAKEPLDKVGHVVGMPQWIASEDGVQLRPAGALKLGEQLGKRMPLARCGGFRVKLPQLFAK